MRFFKASLRTLIMLTSTFSFLGGWILLAHSLKPTSGSSSSSGSTTILPNVALTALPTLAPLPGMDAQETQSSQPAVNPFTIISQPQQQAQVMPMFITSGS